MISMRAGNAIHVVMDCNGPHARSEMRWLGPCRSAITVTEERKTRTKTAKMGRICGYLAEQTLIRHDPCK